MDASQILPNLLVGSYPAAPEDIDRLQREFGVTAVLSLQSDEDLATWDVPWHRLEAHYQRTGIEVLRVPVWDFDRDDLRRKLPQCVGVLDKLLQQGHTVYLALPNMGVNRSPSVAIAYLHWIEAGAWTRPRPTWSGAGLAIRMWRRSGRPARTGSEDDVFHRGCFPEK